MTSVCWWCCHDIDGDELRLPLKHVRTTNEFSFLGYFCSWSCMKSYNMDKHPLHVASTINSYMLMLRNKGTPIKLALPRHRLKMFGGSMDIDEFRRGCDRTPLVYKQKNQGVIPCETRRLAFNEIRSDEKLAEIKGSITTNEPLRLKRERPLKRDQSNLEGLLGIKRRAAVSTV